MDPGDYLEDDPIGIPWELAEILGWGLALIIAVLIATGVVTAAVLEATFGPEHSGVLGFANSGVLGQAFQQGTFWAEPQVATVFVLGSLGLAWWQIEAWTAEDGETEEGAATHMRRARIVVKAVLVISVLCIMGGLLFVIGHCLVSAPADDWSAFIESLGLAIGSLLLGVIGIYASTRLLKSVGNTPT